MVIMHAKLLAGHYHDQMKVFELRSQSQSYVFRFCVKSKTSEVYRTQVGFGFTIRKHRGSRIPEKALIELAKEVVLLSEASAQATELLCGVEPGKQQK